MKISCLIIDDEPLARKGIEEYVDEVSFLELKGVCENTSVALKLLNEHKIDLIFLDIQMPKMTGIEFLKTLPNPPMVIFTTAYSKYALESYELDVLDYLIKPIPFERFLKACNKAKEFYELKQNKIQGKQDKTDYFFIRSDNRYEKILFDEVLFIEALENYVIIHTKARKYICYLTLKSVEDYLPADKFIKVHKSYIVPIAKVDNIEGNQLKIGGNSIPISRSLKDEVMAKIVNNNILKR